MNCKKCGNLVNNGSNYCTKCGTSVYPFMDTQNYTVKEQKKEFCTKCGTKNQGSRFCGNCGADLYQGQLERKGGIDFLADSAKNLSKNMSKNISADGIQGVLKEKIAELRKMDIKATIKHGAVFAVCMMAFTLLFILIAQKLVNMLPVFQEKFWVENSGLKDVKNYLLAAMYGLEVQHTGRIAATITARVKVFPVLIWLTMIFAAISIFITKKVSGENQKYSMPELVIFSLVNSVAVTLCGIFFKTSAGITKSEYAEFYEEVKLSLSTGLSIFNCLIVVFLVTLCTLVIVNGIKLKQNEKNSTFLYAFRSNLIFVGAVLLSMVLIAMVCVVKFIFLGEEFEYLAGSDIGTIVSATAPAFASIGLMGIIGGQSFYAAATGFVSSLLMKVNGKDIIGVSMSPANIKTKLADLTLGKVSNKWMMAVIVVLMVFILVRVVLDVVRILKNTNTEDLQTTAVELGKYSAGFALFTAFIANLSVSYFKAKLNIPSYLEELSGYEILNGKSMEISLGAGNPVGVFFKVFILVLAVSLITYWVVKHNARIVDTYILAKKKLVMLVAVILVCLPAVSVVFTSKEKAARMGSYESFMELVGSENIGEEEMERTLEKAGLNEEVLNEWNGVYGLMKELAGME